MSGLSHEELGQTNVRHHRLMPFQSEIKQKNKHYLIDIHTLKVLTKIEFTMVNETLTKLPLIRFG